MEAETIICPCCRQERNILRETPLPQIEARNPQPGPGLRTQFEYWWDRPPGWTVRAVQEDKLQWACWTCLESGAALFADPRQQRFCLHAPYLAYFDRTLACADCGQPFVFSAAEQQYWYETLHFLVQSTAKQCLPCRRRRRETSKIHREIQALLTQLQPRNVEQLLALAELYHRLGSLPRAREYLTRAQKHASTPEQQAAVAALRPAASGSDQVAVLAPWPQTC